jgi:hypothetical protein
MHTYPIEVSYGLFPGGSSRYYKGARKQKCARPGFIPGLKQFDRKQKRVPSPRIPNPKGERETKKSMVLEQLDSCNVISDCN